MYISLRINLSLTNGFSIIKNQSKSWGELDLHHYRWLFDTRQVIYDFLVFIIWIDKIKFKLVDNSGNDIPCHHLCQALTYTNSLSSEKRSKAQRMSFLARWSQVVWRRWVESVRDVLFMFNPLIRVVMQSIHVNIYLIVRPESESLNFSFLCKVISSAKDCRSW